MIIRRKYFDNAANSYLHHLTEAVWISISADLIDDARRDLSDIGAGKIPVHDLKNFKNILKLSENDKIQEGVCKLFENPQTDPLDVILLCFVCCAQVLFSTYSLLVSGAQKGKSTSRLSQIVEWCGGSEFDGVLALDECHKAKNLKESKSPDEEEKIPSTKTSSRGNVDEIKVGSLTACAVRQLQELLPRARVVYVSATGASTPEHLKYASRLGLWGSGTAFRDARAFVEDIKEGGVGAMELLAMEVVEFRPFPQYFLKLIGLMIEPADERSRSISVQVSCVRCVR